MELIKVCIDKVSVLPRDSAGRLILDKTKLWKNPKGSGAGPVELAVGFMDGDQELQEKVLRVAREWSQHAYVRFERSPRRVADLPIRISFQPPFSWSYVGTDAERIPGHQPTMTLGWLTRDSTDREIRRVVLHEFGHALGCVHEHFHPDGGIPWDEEKVYEWYGKNNGWSREMVKDQVLTRYDRSSTFHTVLDRQSIMLYPIDPALTDGKYSSPENVELSDLDKAFIRQLYPWPE